MLQMEYQIVAKKVGQQVESKCVLNDLCLCELQRSVWLIDAADSRADMVASACRPIKERSAFARLDSVEICAKCGSTYR